jgi:hypothetical protein
MVHLGDFAASVTVNYFCVTVRPHWLVIAPLVGPEGGGPLVPDAARALSVPVDGRDLRRLGELLLALGRAREIETDPPDEINREVTPCPAP